MADKLKWADVAHMYVSSDIEGLQNWGPNSIHPKAPKSVLVTLDALRLSTIFDGVVEFTPILRAMEDITEPEAREWFKMEEGKDWPEGGYMEHRTAKERWMFFLNVIRKSDLAEMSPTYSVTEFHWLLKKGFNVFDLEWGAEAIRKEANP